MLKTYRLLMAVTLALMAGTGMGQAQRDAARPGWNFLGRWKANYARSDVKGSLMIFTTNPAGEMTTTYQGLTSTFKIDGREWPAAMGTMATWTQSGSRAWRTVWKMAGAVNNIDTLTLSADDKTLTMDTEYFLPKPNRSRVTFTRQSGGPGLTGVWKAEATQMDAFEFELTARDARTVQFAMLSAGGTANTPVDGTEVPVSGPATMVPPGLTVSFKVIDADSFDFTVRLDGKRLSTARYKVSPDGRSMVSDGVSTPDSTPEKATFTFELQ